MKRKSLGFFIEEGHYIGFSILEKLEEDFEEICYDEDNTLIGFFRLRKNLTNIYFERHNLKRKRNENINSDNLNNNNNLQDENFNSSSKLFIYGIGHGTFNYLSQKIKDIRSQNSGQKLNSIHQNGVISFFSLFNTELQNDLNRIKFTRSIYCRIVDDQFNQTWGYHGPVNRGTAFLFENVLLDDSIESKHYCLGNGCPYGCLMSSFRV